MQVAVIGDIHGSSSSLRRIIPELRKVDIIFVTGDIGGTTSLKLILKSIIKSKKISRKKYAELVFTEFLSEFSRYQLKSSKEIIKILLALNKPIFLTHGNADVSDLREYFKKIDEKNTLFHYLENSVVKYGENIIVGYGYCQPSEYLPSVRSPGRKLKEEIENDLCEIENQITSLQQEEYKFVFGLYHIIVILKRC